VIPAPKNGMRYFGGDVQSWMNLQTAYEIKVADKLVTTKVFAGVQSTTGIPRNCDVAAQSGISSAT